MVLETIQLLTPSSTGKQVHTHTSLSFFCRVRCRASAVQPRGRIGD